MNTEQREEIESLCHGIELGISHNEARGINDVMLIPQPLLPLVQFTRQQLNLRVDGEKFRKNFKVSFERHWSGANYSLADIPEGPDELSRRVLECLTTTPEEKE